MGLEGKSKETPTASYEELQTFRATAKEMGLRVPEDLSIVGYDNTHLAALNQISLTSVDQPRRAMGRSAAALLSDRISGPGKPSRLREVSPSLVVRTSSGPAPE